MLPRRRAKALDKALFLQAAISCVGIKLAPYPWEACFASENRHRGIATDDAYLAQGDMAMPSMHAAANITVFTGAYP
jgi:hypothetical protein